jgi:hypothetical protein
MASPAVTSTSVSINFILTEEQRPYMVVGQVGGVLPIKFETYIADLKKPPYSLEAVNIDDSYRRDMKLPGFEGKGVFIQKHNLNDPDHTPGKPLGSDILETYQKMQAAAVKTFGHELTPHADASKNLIAAVNNIEGIYGDITNISQDQIEMGVLPLYKGIKDTIRLMQPVAAAPARPNANVDLAAKVKAEGNVAQTKLAIQQTEEQMATIKLLMDEGVEGMAPELKGLDEKLVQLRCQLQADNYNLAKIK